MDRIYEARVRDSVRDTWLKKWYRRLAGDSWGHTHWRCEEGLNSNHFEYGNRSKLDETWWMSMLLVCKRMYPEVLISIFEYHTFYLNNLSTAYWLLVLHPPPLMQLIRHLDLTLGESSSEYSPFMEDRDATKGTRLSTILDVLSQFVCLHDLRLSFDVWDRQSWPTLQENDLLSDLKRIRVLKRFTVQLPPTLSKSDADIKLELPYESNFEVERRPKLRYWISPGIPPMAQRVQRIHWDTAKDTTH
ncbi:hypothetical protein AB5N19_00544 [Seiridium cardinale]